MLQPLVEAGDFGALAQRLAHAHPADVADYLQSLNAAAMRDAFRALAPHAAAEILLEFDDPYQEQLVESQADEPQLLASVVDEMEMDDAADVLEVIEEQSEALARDVLERMDDELQAEVRQLRQYPPESAGGRMHTDKLSLHERHSAEETLDAVRTFGARHHTSDLIHNVFVVDEHRVFVGTVDLYEVVLADPATRLSEIIDRDAPFAPAFLDQEEVAQLFKRHDVISLPVTNMSGHVIGRITADDVLDVIEEEATEDMYRLAGLDEEDHIFSRPRDSIRKRLPWLFVNIVTCTLAAGVIALFEGTIEEVAVLAVFVPIIAGLGGNAGIQTLTLTVRSLALGELQFQNARGVILKEVTVGLFNGLLAGLGVGLIAWAWRGSLVLAGILVVAMVASLFFAVLAGSVVPLLLKRVRIDPALASGIFVTALTDGFGFFAFLGLATLLLKFL